MTPRPIAALLLPGLAACVPLYVAPEDAGEPGMSSPYVQGMIGVSHVSRDPRAAVAGGGNGSATLPLLAAAVQIPMAGEHVQTGFEWGGTFAWDHDRTVVDDGTGVAAADDDLVLADLFAGLSLVTWFGETARLFAGAGPVLQFGWTELEYEDQGGETVWVQDSAAGGGIYARAGLELPFSSHTWVGLQVRWMDADLDFGGDAGSVDLETAQWVLSVTQGF
ncbi:MAG: hypothetical protein AB1726_15970 [Planctomycetota bacterium]